MNTIDCKGLKCPQPVINVKKYFDTIESGTAEVIIDNEVAKNNISKLANSCGFKYETHEKDGLYSIKITKDATTSKIKDETSKNPVIVISTDKLGVGDDKLGAILMKSYLYALSESDVLPTDILFLNSGVKLTICDSTCLETIKAIKEKGVNIMSCGTCLDFYNIKEKLEVGEITNMYTIVEKMNTSNNCINL
jgi:selenium metabolism protein YedF